MDEIWYSTDDEDQPMQPLDHVTASSVSRHLRLENRLLRSELSDFTLYRNQREERRLHYEYRNLELASRVASSGIDQQRKALVQSLRRTRRIVSCPGTSFRPRQRYQKNEPRQPANINDAGSTTKAAEDDTKITEDVHSPNAVGVAFRQRLLDRSTSLFIPTRLINDSDYTSDAGEDDGRGRRVRLQRCKKLIRKSTQKNMTTSDADPAGPSTGLLQRYPERTRTRIDSKIDDRPRVRIRTISVGEHVANVFTNHSKTDKSSAISTDDWHREADDSLEKRLTGQRATIRTRSLKDNGTIGSKSSAISTDDWHRGADDSLEKRLTGQRATIRTRSLKDNGTIGSKSSAISTDDWHRGADDSLEKRLTGQRATIRTRSLKDNGTIGSKSSAMSIEDWHRGADDSLEKRLTGQRATIRTRSLKDNGTIGSKSSAMSIEDWHRGADDSLEKRLTGQRATIRTRSLKDNGTIGSKSSAMSIEDWHRGADDSPEKRLTGQQATIRTRSLKDNGSIGSHENAMSDDFLEKHGNSETEEPRKNSSSRRQQQGGAGRTGLLKRRQCPFAAMRSLSLQACREDAVNESEVRGSFSGAAAAAAAGNVGKNSIGVISESALAESESLAIRSAECSPKSGASAKMVDHGRKEKQHPNNIGGMIELTSGCYVPVGSGNAIASFTGDSYTGSTSNRTHMAPSDGYWTTTSINTAVEDSQSFGKASSHQKTEFPTSSRTLQSTESQVWDNRIRQQQVQLSQSGQHHSDASRISTSTVRSFTVAKLTSRMTSVISPLPSMQQPSRKAFQIRGTGAAVPSIRQRVTSYQLYCSGRRRSRQGRPLSMPVTVDLKTIVRSMQ